ncbi:MAG: DUF4349 domain-containing protein [Acidothermaceae bacterium]
MRHPVTKRRHFVLGSAAAAACAIALISGCDASSSKGAATSGVENGPAHGAPADGQGGTSGFGLAPAASAAGAAESVPAAAPSAAASAAGSSGGTDTPPLLANRDVIYTADITVKATNIKQAVSSVESLVGNHGGVVYAEQVDLTPKDPNNPGDASATITLKVPPDQLAATLSDVSGVGTEVSRNENSDDVTSKVVDVNARIDAANASIARLTDLLNHTGSVADLLNVESDLSQRDADLESLEQQQKALKAQTSQATITVHLVATPPVAKTAPPVKKAHVFGFLRGLRGGWHAFTATVSGVATALGALLPFLILLAIVGIAAFFGRRRFAHSHRSGEPAAPTEGV